MFGNSGHPLNFSLFHPFEELQSLNLTFNWFGGLLDNHEGYKSLGKLPKLKILDLSDNGLNNSILPFLRFATSLKTLILGNNMMEGDFPMKGICKWKTLQELDVSRNEFEGQPPLCFAGLTKLRVLDLSSNLFEGDLPAFINSLKSLEYLSLLDNNFKVLFSFNSLKIFSKLKVLKLSSISIKQQTEMRGSWLPEFKIRVLELRDCNLEKIPDFLRYQKNMRLIDLSNNKLSGPFPTWILENNPRLEVLNLQNNALHTLRLPSLVHNLRLLDLSANNFEDRLSDDFGKILSSLRQINLSSNKFKGRLPTSVGEMKDIHAINFAHNNFSGNLPRSLFMGCHFLKLLKLSHNRFDGQIFPASTNLTWLGTLLVDNNMFTGTIGNGLRNSTMLRVLDMSSNFLTGTIPSWMGEEFVWSILLMSNNSLEGTIPLTLFDSETLELVDLSRNNNVDRKPDVRNNELSGSIPQFINASGIAVLLLRGNDLVGPIPRQLCSLSSIRILDLANNKLNESIPPCLSNLSFGAAEDSEELDFLSGIIPYMDGDMGTYFESILELDQITPDYMYGLNFSVEFSAKQRYDSYDSGALDYMYGLDLSNNELSGEIPEEVGDLVRARSLNLSHNSLAGSIPESFSKMKDIESLDLSFNKLYGPIPFPLTAYGCCRFLLEPWRDIFHGSGWNLCVYVL
ncbi:receptor-like protein 9b [Brassica rapa]|uniref:receptor-like protein 9b n=1 Tax=Brassica campestris TaxID=3711 RepID=UPI0004F18956|nr:receptor-like protein 9b [Brassica rapa]